MEEGSVDREQRAGARWRTVFLIAYCAFVVFCLTSYDYLLLIFGVLNVPLVVFFLVRRFMDTALDDVPRWWRWYMHLGWHGKHRAFDDYRVRVLDGEKDTPSRVFAADIFEILNLKPSAMEIGMLEARCGNDFFKGVESPAEGEWLFTDAACLAFVRAYLDDQRSDRGRTALRLTQWLERSVFMPIDNRRTAQTGKDYPFTSGTLLR